jgi:hypothetical protein
MKKTYLLSLITLIFVGFAANSQERQDTPGERAEFERRQTADPKTGLVPRDELEKSRNIMSKMIKLMAPVPNVNWAERGPNNVGGRTRALMWDPNDPTKKKVWAGGVTGGLWYNNDITDANSTWQKVNDFWDNIAIGDIAFDPTNTQIMYVGTGERGSSGDTRNTGGSGGGGGAIWKSTNGGTTWTRLTSTIPDYVTNSPNGAQWREVLKIIVNYNGNVFALGYWGIFRSKNGGQTWQAVTGTVAPPTTNSGRVSDMELGTDGILYVSEGGDNFEQVIYKSTDSTVTNFTTITPAGSNANGNGRVEIALAPSTNGANQVIYAVSASSEVGVKFFKKSVNAGTSWTDMAIPLYDDLNGGGEKHFVGNQGWYDLILGTHATNANILYAGGVTYGFSTNGGTSWLPKMGYSAYQNLMHVDNHAFAARPGFPNEAVFGNDGGVYYANDWATSGPTNYPALQARNKNYNVTQYFAVDMNGVANNSTVIGGTQDNGTHTITSTYGTVGSGFAINSGDGGLCFIDKLDSNIVISSYTHVSPKISKRGPLNNSCFVAPGPCDYLENELVVSGDNSRGQFINPADYDSPNHTLYNNYTLGSEPDSKIVRHHITGTSPNYTATRSILTLTGQGALNITFLKLGKTQGNIFIGTSTGDVFKVTGVNLTGNQTLTMTKIMDKTTTSTGNVSSIDFGTDENTIIVTKSNYNIVSVHYTTTGGGLLATDWTSKDESTHGLPNVPIRYALINPVDTKQVLLATELGVWSTTDITAANPQWAATNASLANVRCDMLKFRASDNTVAVGTHGRGIFTAKINQNSTPCPTTLVLISTANDTATGTTTFQASETITASNKITGNANVTMRAAKSVELKPSTNGGGNTFEAANGTVFQAFIAGCQN